jgi:hypothetical protein
MKMNELPQHFLMSEWSSIWRKDVPSTSRKIRDGEAATKPSLCAAVVDSARFWGGHVFIRLTLTRADVMIGMFISREHADQVPWSLSDALSIDCGITKMHDLVRKSCYL